MNLVYGVIILAASMLWMKLLTRIDRYRKDKGHTHIILAGFIMGCLSMAIAHWFYAVHPLNQGYDLPGPLHHLLVVGPSEELAKFLAFIVLACVRSSIKEPQDGMLQGAAVGLGFSAMENFFYAQEYGLVILIFRSILSSLGHMLYASFWGHAWGSAVFASLRTRRPPSYGRVLAAFIPAAIVHGVYNSLLSVGTTRDGIILGTMFDILVLVVSATMFHSLFEASPYFPWPYFRSSQAIRSIRHGLELNTRSLVLQRRLALCCLAAGRYKEAHRRLESCMQRVRARSAYRVFDGVALLGLGRRKEGEAVIKDGWEKLTPRQRLHLKIELRRMIRSKNLFEHVMALIKKRSFGPNIYPAHRLRLGHADYWKSDSRILAEKMATLEQVIRKKNPVVMEPFA